MIRRYRYRYHYRYRYRALGPRKVGCTIRWDDCLILIRGFDPVPQANLTCTVNTPASRSPTLRYLRLCYCFLYPARCVSTTNLSPPRDPVQHRRTNRIATMPKSSKKTSSTQNATPAEPVTLNEALVSEYPDDFVVQYMFAPAAKTPRRMLRYESPNTPHTDRCELIRQQIHTCDRHACYRVPPDL